MSTTRMIAATRLTPANASATLRTTVPIALVRMLNLKEGSMPEWDVGIRDGKMVALVQQAKQGGAHQ